MHVIDFNADGTVKAMYSDKFPLAFLGAQEIHRATEIEFDAQRQHWRISAPPRNGRQYWLGYGFDSYESARSFEVEWANRCRLHQTELFSAESFAIAEDMMRS